MSLPGLTRKILAREWFYRFKLPGGAVTKSYLPDDVVTIHDTRLAMINELLEPLFAGRWGQTTCLDVACHEGFFASELARHGCRDVLGIEARFENVENANLIKQVYELSNLRIVQRDFLTVGKGEFGRFDIVLMLGLLYHLENPLGALKIARSHTKSVCLVESQVSPNLPGIIDWGSYRFTKEIVGSFAVVDETQELESGNREANTSGVSLVPSLPGLLFAMEAVGFSRVEVLKPPPDANEQLSLGKRVMVAGYVD